MKCEPRYYEVVFWTLYEAFGEMSLCARRKRLALTVALFARRRRGTYLPDGQTTRGDLIEGFPVHIHIRDLRFPPPSRVCNSRSSLRLLLTSPVKPWMRGHMHPALSSIYLTPSPFSNRPLPPVLRSRRDLSLAARCAPTESHSIVVAPFVRLARSSLHFDFASDAIHRIFPPRPANDRRRCSNGG